MEKTNKELAVELTIALLEYNSKFINANTSVKPVVKKSDDVIAIFDNIFKSIDSK